MTIVLSQELSAIAADFISRRTEISLDEIRDTGSLLAGLSQLAFSQERELEIHRLREVGKPTSELLASLWIRIQPRSFVFIARRREKLSA